MTQNVSGFGLKVYIRASRTLPIGHTFTQFADDVDPLDIPSFVIATTSMGLNGDLIKAQTASPIPAAIGLIPGGSDDKLMGILHEANRVGRGKSSIDDEITMVITYPNGDVTTLSGGAITEGPVGKSVASAGRYKSNVYLFNFENKVGI
jgi:hypothetical protein